jgi:hypothetical protein
MSSLTSKTTSIEDLPNELFYEIFRYVDDIFYSFENLNSRFTSLIQATIPQLKAFKLPNYYRYEVREFFDHYPIETFTNLQSLALDFLDPSILFKCRIVTLIKLKRLSLTLQYFDWRLEDFYFLRIAKLPNLKYLKLALPIWDMFLDKSPSLKSLLHIDDLPKIEQLKIFVVHTKYLSDIELFFHLFPNLEKLVLTKRTNDGYDDRLSNSILTMPTLVSLQLSGHRITFGNLSTLFTVCPNLIEFALDTSNREFYRASDWQRLLSTMKSLFKFNLNVTTSRSDAQLMSRSYIDRIMLSFDHTFWLSRNWIACPHIKQDTFNLKIVTLE